MGNKIQAIIFDCFGVMITDGLEAEIQRLEKTDPTARGYISENIRLANSGKAQPYEAYGHIAERFGMDVPEWMGRIAAGEVKNTELLKWIVELRQHYKTGLISNIARGGLQRRFSADELKAWFDVTIVSAEVGVMKPDPEIYQLAAGKLGVSPAACVFIDDREVYAEGARKVGMEGVYYKSFQQAKSEVEKLL